MGGASSSLFLTPSEERTGPPRAHCHKTIIDKNLQILAGLSRTTLV